LLPQQQCSFPTLKGSFFVGANSQLAHLPSSLDEQLSGLPPELLGEAAGSPIVSGSYSVTYRTVPEKRRRKFGDAKEATKDAIDDL